jgi:hypothetical protein
MSRGICISPAQAVYGSFLRKGSILVLSWVPNIRTILLGAGQTIRLSILQHKRDCTVSLLTCLVQECPNKRKPELAYNLEFEELKDGDDAEKR